MQSDTLEMLDGESWRAFVAADAAFLMLGKSDCEPCKAWTAELQAFLAAGSGAAHPRVRFGKLLLDSKGLTDFKRENQSWLKDLETLPWNLLYVGGTLEKSWPGGGIARLEGRLSGLGL
jgi:hypothetical protein